MNNIFSYENRKIKNFNGACNELELSIKNWAARNVSEVWEPSAGWGKVELEAGQLW
jgi:hypothetical protein